RSRRSVRGQALAEADDVVGAVAERGVERERLGVARADLQVDLGAAEGLPGTLDVLDQRTAVAAAAVVGVDGQVVQPAALTVEARHPRGDDDAVDLPHDEQLALHRELAVDVAPRVVPRPGQPAALPQPHDGVAVGRLEGPDAPRHRRRLAPATAHAGTPSSHLPAELAPRTARARPD